MKNKEELISRIDKKVKLPEKKAASENLKNFNSPRFFFDKSRFTYTFLFQGEAASIHFDALREEIFYRGHNIRNMNLSEDQLGILKQTVHQLLKAGQAPLSEHYRMCLSKMIIA